MAEIDMKIVDLATPEMQKLAAVFPKELKKALSSTGWWLKKEIQEGIAAGAPGGQPYLPKTPVYLSGDTYEQYNYSNRHKGKKLKQRSIKTVRQDNQLYIERGYKESGKPMGKLKSAVRYIMDSDGNMVQIGWVTPSAERIGTMQEKGAVHTVTNKMRRYYWANARPISGSKGQIVLPKRPTIAPEYRENAPHVAPYIQRRIDKYLFGYE